jgi:hypothetical protein
MVRTENKTETSPTPSGTPDTREIQDSFIKYYQSCLDSTKTRSEKTQELLWWLLGVQPGLSPGEVSARLDWSQESSEAWFTPTLGNFVEGFKYVFSGDHIRNALKPAKELLFSCKGCVDQVVGDEVRTTVFKNDNSDDPRGMLLRRRDIPSDGLAEGRWFEYRQYRWCMPGEVRFESVIRILPDESYTPDEAIAAYEEYQQRLPDEF